MKKIIEIVFVFFVSLTFTNCESSDCVEILQAESTCSNLPYLEFVVPMSKEDNFRNAEIMKEANNRVRPYLKIEDGHIELMLKSGKFSYISKFHIIISCKLIVYIVMCFYQETN